MKPIQLLILFALVAAVGCNTCGGDPVTSPTDCVDSDGDGFPVGLRCPGTNDCDDTDDAVNPDAEEVCDDVDNDCDGNLDEGCDGDCESGTTRACGSDIGACTEGNQACVDGEWAECDGQNPVSEECNGVDDDCDGEIDEDPVLLCDDGIVCNGVSECASGACTVAVAPDCSTLAGPCNDGVCSEKDNGCIAAPKVNGEACDDGLFCTDMGTCNMGVCETVPRDCSGLTDTCNTGICDESANTCVARPLDNGTSCDDGLFCMVNEFCVAGVCTGSPFDCSAAGDQCNAGTCDESSASCITNPVTDGTACDDGEYCNVAETCQSGACVGGVARDCSAQGGSCRTGTCNEATDTCDGPAVADGTLCDDNEFCTANDSCLAGSCVGGAARDCSAQDGICREGTCNEALNQCASTPVTNGVVCSDGLFCSNGDTCQLGACLPGPPVDCSPAAMGDPCLIGVCDDVADMCEAQFDPNPPLACCNPAIDSDLDGFGECDDCDDTNGSVYPGAAEFCNGIDENCNGLIDEDFDGDGDGFATCGDNPDILDCNDAEPAVNPGVPEDCGPTNVGNGVDDDCDGYIDELCDPCTRTDVDNDGSTECDGDCDDADPATFPGAPELCDGIDNDCNVFTTPNCGVSDECNHDRDGNFANDADLCREDMICACIVGSGGVCPLDADFVCTSFCNTSETGVIADRCTSTQTCSLDLLRSAGVHGCAETTATPGPALAGESCSSDGDCRSLDCGAIVAGDFRCQDFCGSDAYCPAPGVSCWLRTGQDGRCMPDSFPVFGPKPVGDTCVASSECDHGWCATSPESASDRYCTEACCQDADCPSGFTCSLRGNATSSNFVLPGNVPCAVGADCGPDDGTICFNNVCAWRIVETGSMCIRDVPGQGTRVAGQQCVTSAQCASNFCEVDLGVCVDICCSDADCPTGLGCEFVQSEAQSDGVTGARLCLNLSTDQIVRRR